MSGGISSSAAAAFYNKQLDKMIASEKRNGRLSRIMDSLKQFVTPGMTVLDVGCGTGIISRFMAHLGADVTAVDMAPDLIEYAKSKSNGHKINYIVQDVGDIDLKRTFDAIIMADVLEHIERKDVFRVVLRLLRYHTHEDSLIYLNIPNYSFVKFMQEKYPSKLQIIDEAWRIEDIVSLFDYQGFAPYAMRMYGLDVQAQYIEYLFMTKKRLDESFLKTLEKIY